MIVLDGTIVGIALPTIITDLQLSLTTAQWINSLYAVVFAALLMSCGRAGDMLGRRSLFITGIAIFTVGSLIAALSASAEGLILARAIQGIGGSMVLPSSLATVNATFQGRQRAVAFGVWGATMAAVAAVGPLLGAWLTQSLSWPWIFWVNLPVGLAVISGALAFVANTRDAHTLGFDWLGLALSATGFGALVFAIIEGAKLGWWKPAVDTNWGPLHWPTSRPLSLTAIILSFSVLAIGIFVFHQRRRLRQQRSTILNLSLLQIPTFSWGNVTAAAVAVGEFALVFILPLYLITADALTTMQAGWVLAAMALGALVSGANARVISLRWGAARAVVAGLILEVVGVAATAAVVWLRFGAVVIAVLLAIYGAGLGIASAQLTSTVLADIPVASSGQGSATQSTVRQIGAALGTALSGSILAATMPHALRSQLASTGLPTDLVDSLAKSVTDSAGSLIVGLREAVAAGADPRSVMSIIGGAGADSTFLPGSGSPEAFSHLSGGAAAKLDLNALVSALEGGFAQATTWALLGALIFLILGLVGALRVAVVQHA